ncbi:threonine-phosphate decarboxylase CobD [Geosporobacter ferrireducens]|uniref:threonine-phosphate decarboxylase n=2 Tax=Geosporobacter ferrireducens TaxID=1424294 RepID=A0A1D8GN84_9FIRM|nr:threonine-phosphate decarboxylase CobD [Geosporobacter ferrireducens]AOT72380.1 threonine-phosphate decarboxylase [Geosporobacter ferrireducens]
MMKVAKHGGNIYEVALERGIEMEEILDFSANINPLGIPDSLKEAIMDNIHIIERYPDPEYKELVKAIADYHGVDQQWIAVGNGATELIFALAASLNSKNSLILAPTFSEYERALLKAKSEVHYYYLKEDNGFQIDEGFKKMLNPEIDLLVLCNPNNPTGQFLKRQQMMEILQHCREHGIRLVVDEAFIDFVEGGEMETMIACMHEYNHLYVIRALTKFFAIPGLRLGYAVTSNENILGRIRDNREPWSINSLAALAGEIVLKDKTYIQATKNWIGEEKDNLFKALNAIEGIKAYKPEANYIFFSYGKSDNCLKEVLLSKKILIRSCGNYKNLTDRFYRVAIKDRASNEKLIQALKEVIYED